MTRDEARANDLILTGHDAAAARAMERRCIEAADQGSVEAAGLLAAVYNDGSPVIAADVVKAYRYTARAADLGSSFSRYWLAKLQRDSKDYASALENARKAVDAGESAAVVLLARMTLNGEGRSAAPLEALEMLEHAAEHSDSDAAMLYAELLLDGRTVPVNASRAYEVLASYDDHVAVLDHLSPGTKGRFLLLKAKALRAGARTDGAGDWTGLAKQAAEAGSAGAKTMLAEHEASVVQDGWTQAWNGVSRFNAWGTDWELFHVTGTLVDTRANKSSAITQVGNTVTTSTTHWTEAIFRTAVDQRTVKFEKKARLVPGRSYHLLYGGIAGSKSGTPLLALDASEGTRFDATGSLKSAYPERTGDKAARLGIYLLFLLSIALCFASVVLGVLGIVASVVLAIVVLGKPGRTATSAIDLAVEHLQRIGKPAIR